MKGKELLYCLCTMAASIVCTLYLVQTWHTPHFPAAVIVTVIVAGVMIFGVGDDK